MSDTYKHKEYFKCRRNNFDTLPKVWPKVSHREKGARWMIQTIGHKRRRSAERDMVQMIKTLNFCTGYIDYDDEEWYYWDNSLENFDYELFISKRWSDVWDYY